MRFRGSHQPNMAISELLTTYFHLTWSKLYFSGIYLTALMCITAMSTTVHVVCDKLVASAKVRHEVPYLANKVSAKYNKNRKLE